MAWPDLADSVLTATQDVFGEAAIHTTALGVSTAIEKAIFEEDATVISPELGVPVRSGQPGIAVRLADIPTVPVRGDVVTVRSVEFTVADVVKDGQGGATVLLHRR